MATLQRIRNHGLFLLIIVGLAMLAFILGDALNSGSSFMNKSREYIGEIEGQSVWISPPTSCTNSAQVPSLTS